jgi:hypothetical protein
VVSLDHIIFNNGNEFHMLRHFMRASDQLFLRLQKDGISKEAISKEQSLPGSKFHEEFACCIEDLMLQFKGRPFQEIKGLNGNISCVFDFSDLAHQQGIGKCGVLSMGKIRPEDRKKIVRKKKRGDHDLLFLEVDDLPDTSDLVLVVRPASNHFQFITAYPGIYAPPVPDINMPKAVYDSSNQFWSEHVFLELKAVG